MQEIEARSWVRKIPWRREWQPTPVFSPGKSHGQRSLAGYRPWGRKELDMTEHISTAAIDLRLNPFSPVPKLQSTRLTDPHASNPPVPTFVLHSSGRRFLKESEFLGNESAGKGLKTCLYTRKLIMRRITPPSPCNEPHVESSFFIEL